MRKLLLLIILALIATGSIYVLQRPWGSVPALGNLLDPVDGVYALARNSLHPDEINDRITGLTAPVQVVRDERGVPHIFAENNLDAITALGYAVASDRLFQLDFIPRVAAGRLSEILGPSMIETDRFLRRTGMDWGAKKNLERILEEESLEYEIIQAYVRGVNAYIQSMSKGDLPLEFRLLGYEPELYTALHVIRILQYMTFDLTYRTSDTDYAGLEAQLGQEQFQELFPEYAELFVPIIPEKGGRILPQDKRQTYVVSPNNELIRTLPVALMSDLNSQHLALKGGVTEGFIEGKGSNNWAVGPDRSETGAVILAGDMHLSLWLPSIWYETHMVTPSMNVYGVTIPGAPLPVEGFNAHLGWAFTNTGADQIDYLSLSLDETGTKYKYNQEWLSLVQQPDTIVVKGSEIVIDTLFYSHWGPTLVDKESALSVQWVAHDTSRTVIAQWKMNAASSIKEFQEALTFWDTPMQNIIYGDVAGNIAIRSTGVLPLRKGRHGIGVLNGSVDEGTWVGNVPFDELPYSYNPRQGYLTSTNQQPADSTYPYYQGYDWGPGYRSLRIDALLEGKEKHSVEDIKRYQSDVYVVQRDLFVPLLSEVEGLSERAAELRTILQHWEGESSIDREEPLIFDIFLDNLNEMVWDEKLFSTYRSPKEDRLYALLTGNISDKWLDVQGTEEKENASDIMRLVLEKTANDLAETYGWDKSLWRWGAHHQIVFRHYTRSEALKPLWKGPFEYPGFANTLSPAADRQTTHSASWRMVVDFSATPPAGFGVYPGGQSGNPFSPNYDRHVDTYLSFSYFPLLKPDSIENFLEGQISSTIALSP